MTKREKIDYWMKSAAYDWAVAGHLYEKGDYPYALFLGHLTIEKSLKALYIDKINKTPPFVHRLTYLAEKIDLDLSQERLEMMEIITDFNLEARYPDEKFSFHKKCTKEFTNANMKMIEELKKWLLQQIR